MFCMIGRIIPREFRLHDNNARPGDITVHEIFIAEKTAAEVKICRPTFDLRGD